MHIQRFLTRLAMLTCGVLAASSAHAEGFQFVDGNGYRELLYNDQPLYRYMTPAFDPADRVNTYKPYLHLYGLHGEGFITKSPGGSETHHRGIFFGYSCQHGNFWTMRGGETQRHRSYDKDREQITPNSARMASMTEWVTKDDKVVARDTREVTATRIAADQYNLDFDITLAAVGEDLELKGDPHHGGFHFRAHDDVQGRDASGKLSLHAGSATYIMPTSSKLIKDDTWSNTPWVACLFSIKDNPYIVIHMDHPDNPKPTTYSTRPYGRFGAFFTGKIPVDKPAHLRYRIVYLDGKTHAHPTTQSVETLYQDFVQKGS